MHFSGIQLIFFLQKTRCFELQRSKAAIELRIKENKLGLSAFETNKLQNMWFFKLFVSLVSSESAGLRTTQKQYSRPSFITFIMNFFKTNLPSLSGGYCRTKSDKCTTSEKNENNKIKILFGNAEIVCQKTWLWPFERDPNPPNENSKFWSRNSKRNEEKIT